MNLYKRIEALCAQKGINVTQMCKEAGISRGSMGDLANGRISSLSAKALMKISEYFDVSMDYLTGKQDLLVGTEVRKIIKQISLDLNEDYAKLEQLFLTKEFPRTINYNSLLYFFSVYLERPLVTIDSIHNSPNNNELMALIKQLTPEQQDLVAAQIKGILAQKKDPSLKGDG